MFKNEQENLEENLQTVTDEGKPVPDRIATASVAHSIYKRMLDDNFALAYQRLQVQRQIDGNPAINQDELERLGLGWESNINSRSSEKTIDTTVNSLWDMFTSTDTLTETTVNDIMEKLSDAENVDYGHIIDKNFDRMVRDWCGFNYLLKYRLYQMVAHGNGPVIWNDKLSWKSEALDINNVLLPFDSKSSIDGFEIICVIQDIDPASFFKMINSGNDGWNKNECRKYLIEYYKDGSGRSTDKKYSEQECIDLEHRIRNHDISLDSDFQSIRVVNVMYKEVDTCKISHCIIRPDNYEKDTEFLYKRKNKYEKMQHAINFMLFDIGDGYINGIKSLGLRIFSINDINDRLMNETITGAYISSGLLIKMMDNSSQNVLSEIYHGGGVTTVPANVEIAQQTFAPPLQNLVQVMQMLNNKLNQNVGIYESSPSLNATGSARTATEVDAQLQNEARFEANQSAWYYVQHEEWLRETMRRALSKTCIDEDAKLFRKRCIEDGVPEELLSYDKLIVRAKRSIGFGSPYMRQRIATTMLQAIPLLELDQAGKNRVQREFISAQLGWKDTDEIKPSMNRNLIPSTATHIAICETNDMLNGQDAVVSPNDDQKLHLETHLRIALQKIEAFRSSGQQDPSSIAMGLQKIIEHGAMHNNYFKQNPQNKAEAQRYTDSLIKLTEVYKQFAQVAQQLAQQRQKMIEEQQKQQQEQQDINYKFELDKFKIMTEAREMANVKLEEARMLNESRETKTQTSANATNAKTQQSMALQRLTTENAEMRENIKLSNELARMNAKTRKGN